MNVRPSGVDSRRRPRPVRREGYRNVSIRKIAERIEYSPAAIYSYFASKDDIYLALAEEGFRRLDARLRAAPQDGARWRVRAGWWAFYEFSKEQPEYFELMFVDRSVPQDHRGWEGFEILQQLMAEAATRMQAPSTRANCPRRSTPRRDARHLGRADRAGGRRPVPPPGPR